MNERWTQHLQNEAAEFEHGRVVHFKNASLKTENTNAICDLSHYGVLEISGNDAGVFLQGQLTNDVLALGVGDAQWNGWCSAKGRLLVSFLLWRDEVGYFVLLPKSLQAAIQKRLGMFVLRSKVTITDVGATWQRFGVIADATNGNENSARMRAIKTAETTIIKLTASRSLVLANADALIRAWQQYKLTHLLADASRWDLAGIRDGVIEITPETQDAYVPQMVNFELIGAVNFKKGCYPGQEIVARTQYRGILKRRMVRATFVAPDVPIAGTPLYSPAFADQVAGTIALAARTDENNGQAVEALIVAQIEAITTDSLFLDIECTRKLRLLDLPYPVL